MNSTPLMSLGYFVFSLQTAPFSTIKRNTSQDWVSNRRIGQGPAHQWVGPQTDQLTIDGVLAPELTGGRDNLDTLRRMSNEGKAWILLSGLGENLGTYFIATVRETASHHAGPGLARRIEFTLKLTRYYGGQANQLGALETSA